ncbi:hypothetical protein VMUT_1087 [Vulcanisaeta moutnovskia 768-28]|uniref:Glycosyl transferase group 1 n=1 Tax=Vulcanisaeta moutnovskia (strain 768-28) TaxID=985053 RepID=F0QY55_VULM7|nr:hypothetical protein VMUT_1087 [Vulcanisaeta moutnovskia 768-28]
MYEGDFLARHELGFVASLATSHEVTVLDVESNAERIEIRKILIKSDDVASTTLVKIPANYLRNRNFNNKIKPLIGSYDIIITSARRALLLSRRLSKDEPLVLRLWSIRANKVIDNLAHGVYKDIVIFMPSLIANTYYINIADIIITEENATYTLARRISKITSRKPVVRIYPPYGTIIDDLNSRDIHNDSMNSLLDLIERFRDTYILGTTILKKRGEYAKFEALPHAMIYYLTAKKNPGIPFFILGSTKMDFIQRLGIAGDKVPPNMFFLNDYLRYLPDRLIERVYMGARIIINYISNRSISNRLIEALYYGKPIITNRMAQVLHPELKHGIHAHIVHREDYYPNAIKEVYENDQYLNELSKNAKLIYKSMFSSTTNLKIFNRIITYVIT